MEKLNFQCLIASQKIYANLLFKCILRKIEEYLRIFAALFIVLLLLFSNLKSLALYGL